MSNLIRKRKQGQSAAALLRDAVQTWDGRFQTEADINGADAVDWLAEFIREAKKITRRARKR